MPLSIAGILKVLLALPALAQLPAANAGGCGSRDDRLDVAVLCGEFRSSVSFLDFQSGRYGRFIHPRWKNLPKDCFVGRATGPSASVLGEESPEAQAEERALKRCFLREATAALSRCGFEAQDPRRAAAEQVLLAAERENDSRRSALDEAFSCRPSGQTAPPDSSVRRPAAVADAARVVADPERPSRPPMTGEALDALFDGATRGPGEPRISGVQIPRSEPERPRTARSAAQPTPLPRPRFATDASSAVIRGLSGELAWMGERYNCAAVGLGSGGVSFVQSIPALIRSIPAGLRYDPSNLPGDLAALRRDVPVAVRQLLGELGDMEEAQRREAECRLAGIVAVELFLVPGATLRHLAGTGRVSRFLDGLLPPSRHAFLAGGELPQRFWNRMFEFRGAILQQRLARYRTGLIGRSLRDLDLNDLNGKSMDEITRLLEGKGFRRVRGCVKKNGRCFRRDGAERDLPQDFYIHPDGGVVRVKPEGGDRGLNPEASKVIFSENPPAPPRRPAGEPASEWARRQQEYINQHLSFEAELLKIHSRGSAPYPHMPSDIPAWTRQGQDSSREVAESVAQATHHRFQLRR